MKSKLLFFVLFSLINKYLQLQLKQINKRTQATSVNDKPNDKISLNNKKEDLSKINSNNINDFVGSSKIEKIPKRGKV